MLVNENKNSGFVKIYRSLMDKSWYKKDSYVKLWLHIILKANHTGKDVWFNGRTIHLNRGQLLTGRKKLSGETGIHESSCERILTYFEKNEQQIEQQKTSKNRIITIVNYDLYHSPEQQTEQPVNNQRTTSEQPVNTNKKEKNIKKEKNKYLLSEIEKNHSENDLHKEITLSFWKLFKTNMEEIGINSRDLKNANNSWIDHVRKLMEIDKYTIEEIKEVYIFLQNNEFWKKNVRSTKKLREKFEELLIKSRSNEKKVKSSGATQQELTEIVHKYSK